MLIQGKLLSGNCDLSEAFAIRRKVFIDELHAPEEKVFDDLDSISMHVIVYEDAENNKAVATGRIYYDGENCELGQLAVLKECRRKKYGDFTTRMLLNKAFTSGIESVFCIAPEESIEFFHNIGFHRISDEIIENGTLLNKMTINQTEILTMCSRMKN